MAKQAVAERIRFHLPKALPKQTRRLVESAIERHQAATHALIAFLDAADGDPDIELDYADPPASMGLDYDELEEDPSHNEPSLGWTLAGEGDGLEDLEADGPAFELKQECAR